MTRQIDIVPFLYSSNFAFTARTTQTVHKQDVPSDSPFRVAPHGCTLLFNLGTLVLQTRNTIFGVKGG